MPPQDAPTNEKTIKNARLQAILDRHYNPLGESRNETFGEFVRRISSGYTIPVLLVAILATTLLTVIVVSH